MAFHQAARPHGGRAAAGATRHCWDQRIHRLAQHCTCQQSEVSGIGASPIRLRPRKTSATLRFAEVDTHLAPTSSCNAAMVRSLDADRHKFSGQERDLNRYSRVLQVKAAGVDQHVQSTCEAGRGHFVAVRLDSNYGLRFVSDLPLFQQLGAVSHTSFRECIVSGPFLSVRFAKRAWAFSAAGARQQGKKNCSPGSF